MKKKWLKKGCAMFLSAAMTLSVFSSFMGIKGTVATVQAADNDVPTSGYWTEVDGLKGFNLSGGTVGKIKFGLNGSDARLWAICGKDPSASQESKDELVLLSTSQFGLDAYGSTSAYSSSNFYNKIDNTYLGYFSRGEQNKMVAVAVTTDEPDGNGGNKKVTTQEEKLLYLPNSSAVSGYDKYEIYVGREDEITVNVSGLPVTTCDECFWLRSPDGSDSDYALGVFPGGSVGDLISVSYNFVSVVPAFNLNLSSVLFASAADAAISEGYTSNMTANTYTLRYKCDVNETASAVISADGTKIKVTNAAGKYLMVQNGNGVYAKSISNNTEQTINASDIVMGSALTDFSGCKVWLESTDTDRITTATLATQEINSVAVTDITAPVANSALDTLAACATTGVSTTESTVTWTPSATTAGYSTEYTASVTLTASAGYEFATDVAATVNGQAATAVKVNDNGTLTVTYTFPATAAAPAEAPKTPKYKITAGAGGTHTLNSDTTLQITCSGALDKLTGIYVDETKLAATNYELVSGSTVLTLKAEYLNTLSVGTHKLKFAYSDGSAETTFGINEASEQGKTTEAPKANETPQTTTTPQTTVTPNATTGTTTTSSNTAATPDTGDFTPIDLMLVVLLLSGLFGAYLVTAELKQRRKK